MTPDEILRRRPMAASTPNGASASSLPTNSPAWRSTRSFSRQLAAITGVSHVFVSKFLKNIGVLTVNTSSPADDATKVTNEHLKERIVDVYDISGVLSLVDGYHRIAAVVRNGGDEIEANVIPGTRVDALRAAVKANSEHGQRRSNADKRRALEVAWENRDILFEKMMGENENHMRNNLPSSRQLAAITGVSHDFANRFISKAMVSSDDTSSPADDATKVTSEHLEERIVDVRALLKKQKDR